VWGFVVRAPREAYPMFRPKVHGETQYRFDVVRKPHRSIGGGDVDLGTQLWPEVGQEAIFVLSRDHERVWIDEKLAHLATQQLIKSSHDQLLDAFDLAANGEDPMCRSAKNAK